MDLALITKFAPLAKLFTTEAGKLDDGQLEQMAQGIAGEGYEEFFSLLKTLRGAEPGVLVSELLGSPTAKKLLLQLQQGAAERDSAIFVKCPHCERNFETSI